MKKIILEINEREMNSKRFIGLLFAQGVIIYSIYQSGFEMMWVWALGLCIIFTVTAYIFMIHIKENNKKLTITTQQVEITQENKRVIFKNTEVESYKYEKRGKFVPFRPRRLWILTLNNGFKYEFISYGISQRKQKEINDLFK